MAVMSSHQIASRSVKPFALALLMISFVMPFFFVVGGLKLNSYRLVLIIFMFPATVRWLNGSAGKIRGIDLLIIAFSVWAAITMFANHGLASKWEFVGMMMIEILAPYFIARAYIRDLESFRYFVWWFVLVILVLLPFAVFESLTEKTPLLDLFGKILDVHTKWPFHPRLGLERAQVTMPHPILFGVFCTPAFALSWYVLGWGKKFPTKAGIVSISGLAVFTSLSSGAFLNIIIQMALMAWNKIFQSVPSVTNKWKMLLACFIGFFFLVELVANRNAFQIFATHMTLTPGTAWARINTFNFVSDDILRNPILGIGSRNWTRPYWMVKLGSIDNFWLVITLRHGFPGLFLLVVPVIGMFFQLGSRPLTGRVADARLGYLIALCGFCVSSITVHLWDASFSLFTLLLGAGVWFLDAEDEKDKTTGEHPPPAKGKRLRYTRFPKGPAERDTGSSRGPATTSAGNHPAPPGHAKCAAQTA